MASFRLAAAGACGFALLSAGVAAVELQYPPTAKRPVTDVYHGVAVTEDYRWLEDDASPEVKRWAADENAVTRGYLDALPQRPAIAARVEELLRTAPVRRYDFQYRGHLLFALKIQPPKNQPILVAIPPSGDVRGERVVVDPNALDPSGHTTIDFFTPSFDGKRVAVSLSKNGSEDGTAHVYDVASGEQLGDEIPGVNYPTGGGSFEWAPDSRGFYYTRYPQGNERPQEDRHFFQQVYFHPLGTPAASDRYVIGRELPRIAEIGLHASRDGKYLLATVRNGDGGEIAYHLRSPDGAWHEVAGFRDGVKQLGFGGDGMLYGMTIKDAPLGRIIAIPVTRPSLASARVVVPESKLVAEEVRATRSLVYVTFRDGGPSLVRVYSPAGKLLRELKTPPASSVTVSEALDADDVLVTTMSYVQPRAVARYDARADRLIPTELAGRYPFNLDDALVEREFAVSRDGTRVPVTIVRRKDSKLDGSNPTLLYGYGGYGITMAPYFSPMLRLWLDYGGIYAVAGVRGGGEYGEPWHLAGNLTHKQNVFDDFAAALEMLIDRKVTRPDKAAIMGGSNGGLLMGATLVQHPQLMRAVVSEVGFYDALRWELQPNGEFNVTEFGTVKDPEQFRAMYAYSPYHQARDGVAYPAVLFSAGDNDGRVAPYESRKMTARLQAATSSANPILLRTEAAAGHGIGTALATRIEEEADVYSFLVDQLGMTASAPRGVAQ
ncbi:MAG TPA: prolyl oligopeptidase family serine peptidase [Casimicrobiaceae bacterium]|nr:prolyl oligopeptidase family serine peptidase [Casimicrobiaceae bacterium]